MVGVAHRVIRFTAMKETLVGLALLAAAAGAAAQSNPGGKITETKDGIVFQRNTPVPPPERRHETRDSPGGPVLPAPAPRNVGPQGPAVVDAAFVTFRGTVVRIEKGEAITIRDGRTGKERRLLLAKGAVVFEGIKGGDAVAVRVPLEEGSGARTADRVELQKTPAATERKSKFAEAQAPGSR
jgi:hypothetical protein